MGRGRRMKREGAENFTLLQQLKSNCLGSNKQIFVSAEFDSLPIIFRTIFFKFLQWVMTEKPLFRKHGELQKADGRRLKPSCVSFEVNEVTAVMYKNPLP